MIVISHSDYPIIFGDSQDYWIITDALNQNISLDAVLDLGDGACLDLGDGAILVLQSNVSVAVGDGTIVIIPQSD